MKDMDFRLVQVVKDTLDGYGIEYKEQTAGGLIYIIVENDNQLAMFLFYGFFEEYVIYDRADSESDWTLRTRGEFNLSFTSVANVLGDIGIYT